MKSKLVMWTLAFLFIAGIVKVGHTGDACCGSAAAAEKAGAQAAPCQHAKEGGCADCGAKCADCPRCAAAGKGDAGDTRESCPGPGKCPHHETCQHACKCAEGAGAKPEGAEPK